MDKTLEMSLLFDFFGDMLTDKQKECFDLYHNDDLSLSEIAEISGISRQGVRDMLVRTESALREFEDKTGVVDRFCKMKQAVAVLQNRALLIAKSTTDEKTRDAVKKLAEDMEELLS